MRLPNLYGWIKADGIVELPDGPFLIWTARYGIALVRYNEFDGLLYDISFHFAYPISTVVYYRTNIRDPFGNFL